MGARGYVVRGLNGSKQLVWATWEQDAHFTVPRRAQAHLFDLVPAIQAWADLQAGCTDVAIFRVRDDGTEERLPSYEEALGALSILRDEVTLAQDHKRGGMSCGGPPLLWTCPPSALKELLRLADGAPPADPLAALEAAERRLLEAGGWKPGPRPGIWADPCGGNCSMSDALYVERNRRRLAAKGGA